MWPLPRDWVRREALRWVLYAGLGFALFIPALVATSVTPSWGSVAVLAVTGAVAFGSTAYIVVDLVRWVRASQYLIVMTPDDYVKLEPGKVTRVPMEAVADPTVKGLPDPGAAMTVTRELRRSPTARCRSRSGGAAFAITGTCSWWPHGRTMKRGDG